MPAHSSFVDVIGGGYCKFLNLGNHTKRQQIHDILKKSFRFFFTHTCKPLRAFTGKRGLSAYNHPNEDTTVHCTAVSRQTKDVKWLDAIQPRMSPYTFNKRHALHRIFASFSSSYTPSPQSRTVCGFLQVLVTCEISCVNPHFDGNYMHAKNPTHKTVQV